MSIGFRQTQTIRDFEDLIESLNDKKGIWVENSLGEGNSLKSG